MPKAVTDLFLIRCTDSNPDGLILWWRPERRGYTTNLDEAGRYTQIDADQIAARRDIDVPVPLDAALKLAVPVVTAESFLGRTP